MFLATPPATARPTSAGWRKESTASTSSGRSPSRFSPRWERTNPLTPPAASEQMVEAAVNAPYVELLTLSGAHLAPLEHPEEFLPRLRAFLDRCRG